MREAIAIYGIEHSMAASNLPVFGLSMQLDTIIEVVRSDIATATQDEVDRSFSANARRFHRA